MSCPGTEIRVIDPLALESACALSRRSIALPILALDPSVLD
jgi:hypothetical protein